MASTKEIAKHLKIALEEIGEIKPVFRQNVNAWVFKHSAYPEVEYGGDSPEEVIKNYPKYLRTFIAERLKGNISAMAEKKTKGRGGYREGAGRPKGSTKEKTARVCLPLDIATWINQPGSIPQLRRIIAKGRQ